MANRTLAVMFGVIDEEAARNAEAYNDTINEANHLWRNMRNTLALGFLPTMQRWAERGRDWLMMNRQIIEQRIDQALDLTTRFIENVGRVALSAGRSVGWFADRFGDLIEGINRITGLDLSRMQAFAGVAAVLLRIFRPWWFWLVAIGIALDELISYIDGADSVLGDFIQWLQDATGASEGLAQAITALLAALGLLAIARPVALLRFFGRLVGFTAGITSVAGAVRGLSAALWELSSASAAASGSGRPYGLLDRSMFRDRLDEVRLLP